MLRGAAADKIQTLADLLLVAGRHGLCPRCNHVFLRRGAELKVKKVWSYYDEFGDELT